jgi:hypothetical protein
MVKKFLFITCNLDRYLNYDPEVEEDEDKLDWSDFIDEQAEICLKIENAMRRVLPDYYIYAFEVGAHGNLHVHVYLESLHSVSLAFIVSCFERVGLPHPDVRKRFGSQEDAINYVKKDLMFIEVGTPVNEVEEVGVRKRAWAYIKENSFHDLLMNQPEVAGCMPFAHCMKWDRDHEESDRRLDGAIEVRWYYGPSGSGKSFTAKKWISNDYIDKYQFIQGGKKFMVKFIPKCMNWWMDNVTFRYYNELETFIGLGGDADFSIEVKQESHYVHCTRLAVTSVFPPLDLFLSLSEEDRRGHTPEEVLRRINHLYHCFKEEGEFRCEEEEDKAITLRPNVDLNNI